MYKAISPYNISRPIFLNTFDKPKLLSQIFKIPLLFLLELVDNSRLIPRREDILRFLKIGGKSTDRK